MARRAAALKLAVVAAIVGAVVVAVALGGFDTLRDGDDVEELLTETGPLGPLVYIVAFVALQPLSLPGALLIVPATFVWSWWEVAIYSLAGGMVASMAGFALARWLAQDWVRGHIPDRLRPWEQRLADHGFAATAGLRLLTGYAPAADWLLGVSRVTLPAFLAGTAVGLAPSTLAMAIWADDAARGITDAPLATLLIAAAVVAVLAMLYRLRSRAVARLGRSAPGLEPGDE